MTVHIQRSFPATDTSKQLEQISDEVGKIARKLSLLSAGSQQRSTDAAQTDRSKLSADAIKHVLKARRMRERYFDADLFADPAWDILLDLLHADLCQHRVSITSLCNAASVPATTALRWISTLTNLGLIQRRPDPRDGRRVFIEFTPTARDKMYSYFAELNLPSVV